MAKMATSGVGVRELPEAHTFDFIGSGPGPVRDFGTERALAEPLGPNTGNFPNSSTRFTLLTELNLTVPKARPEAHTFDFAFRSRIHDFSELVDPLYFVS